MKKPNLFSAASVLCALCVLIMALLVIWGWMTNDALLVQVRPSYPTMKFNTAVCFILCGLALLALNTRYRAVAAALSAAMAAFALATLLQYLTGADLGIDTLFVYPTIGSSAFSPGRMAPNTALEFVLVGLGFMLIARAGPRQLYVALIALIGSIVTVLGAVPTLGFLCGVETAFLWGDFTHMALLTAVAFSVLGVFVVGYAWKKSASTVLWLPIPVLFGLIIVAFLMSQAVRTQEEDKLESELQSRADHAAFEISQQLNDLYQALDRIVVRWDAAGGTAQNLWESDARAYLNGYPYLYGMSKTDVDTKVEWIVNRTGVRTALGFQLNSEPKRAAAIAEVLSSHHPHATVPLTLLDGAKGFLYINALYANGRYDGLQVAGFRTDELFKIVLGEDNLKQGYFTILDGDNILFTNLPDRQAVPERLQKQAIVKANTSVWHLALFPTPEFLESRRSNVPLVVLCIGVIMAVLVSFCTFLAIKGMARNLILQAREAALQKSNSLNNAILSSTGYIIIATEIDGTVIVFNPQAELSLGYKAEEVIGRHTPAVWHDSGEVAARAKQLSRELQQDIKPGMDVFTKIPLLRGSEDREWTFIRKDGTRFPVLLSVTPLHRENQVAGFLGVIRDITERKQMEDALKKSEETFRMAMEHASIGMALVGPAGEWRKVNLALCQLLGYGEAELLCTDFQHLTCEDDLETDLDYTRRMLAGEIETYSVEKRYIHKNGQIIWAILNVSLAKTKDGLPDYFIAQIQDITERKEMERIKNEFISIVSHELRTPLTSIRGALGLVVSGVAGALTDKAQELLTIAHKNSERLVLLINDILDLEKMESGRMPVNLQRMRLAPLLKEAVESNQSYGDKFKVRYRLENAGDAGDVMVDPHRLMQVMANLLSNAAKFSPPNSEVLIRVKRGGGKALVEVQDFGHGIPEEFQGRIFGKFAQADSSSTRRREGTGLGLSISKQLIELMGGEIGFRSAPGAGTVFFFTLRETSADSAAAVAARIAVPQRRPAADHLPHVLHVEDDVDLNRILTEALSSRATLVSATSIEEARARLRDNKFDLVVLDLSLPDGSGLDLLEDLEAQPAASPPVLIVSVREIPPDIQRRVAGALVKLRDTESKIAGTILTMLNGRNAG